MNSKKKIILIVSAFVLVVALATVGVLAATSQTMTITNNISFTATNVNASVSITAKNGGTAIADLDSKTTGNQGTLSKTWQAADTSATTSWETPVITFANKTASIALCNSECSISPSPPLAFQLLPIDVHWDFLRMYRPPA